MNDEDKSKEELLVEVRALRHQLTKLQELDPEHRRADRNQAAEAQRKNESMLSLIINNVPQTIFWKDVNSIYLGCNMNFARAAGLPPAAIIGKTDYDLPWKPEETQAYRADDREVMQSNRAKYHIIETLQQADGNRLWIDTTKMPLHDSAGEVIGVLGVYDDITERKRAEEALNRERDQAQQYLDIAGVLILALNTEGRVILINKRGCDILGYAEEEILGRNWFDTCLPGEIRDEIREVFMALMAGNLEPLEYYENIVVTRGGSQRLLAFHNTVLRDEFSQIIGILSSGEDITERRQAEALLKESEQKFKAIFEHATDGILLADAETKKFYLGNPKIGTMLGYSLEELHNLSVMDIHPPENLPFVLEQFRQLARKEISIAPNVPLLRKDGQVLYADINTTHITLREKTYLAGFFRDVTLRRRAEERLRHSKSLLQAVFDGISDPLFLVDDNMTVKILNRPAVLYYPAQEEKALGKPCYSAFRGKSEPCEGCEVHMAVQKGQKATIERPGLTNPKLTEKVFIYPLHASEGGTTGAIIRVTNITEEKILQQRLVQHEKLSALGLLVAGIAHEINNPNNFISFSIAILRDFCQEMLLILDRYFASNPAAGSLSLANMSYGEFRRNLITLIDNIEYGSNRITATVSNLTGFIRTEDYKVLQPIELNKVIDQAVTICKGQIKKVVKSLAVDIGENIPEIVTSPQALEQVLINFLINAAQAMDKDNSWIKIKAFCKNDSQDSLIIEVQDNGAGLDEETKEKIFDPFFTTKPAGEGTGLGLFISQSLINSLGGAIEMDSEHGQGSTFRIILPILGDNT